MSTLIQQSLSPDKAAYMQGKKHVTEIDKEFEKIKTQESNYLKLQLALIQNQDPLSPSDPKDMAQSMNSFMQVKQGVRMEKRLHEINKTLSASSTLTQAAALKGVDVFFEDGNSIYLNKGEESVIRYDLPQDVKKVDISIYNKNNELVYSSSNLERKEGINEFKWNGKGTDNAFKESGVYRFVMTAKNRNNQELPIKTYGVGPVTQIWNDSKKQKELHINGQNVQMDRLQGFNINAAKGPTTGIITPNNGLFSQQGLKDILDIQSQRTNT